MRRKHDSKAGGSDTGSQTCRWGQQHQEVPFLPRVPRRHRRQCCSESPGRHDIASRPKLVDLRQYQILWFQTIGFDGFWMILDLGVQKGCNSWTEHTTMLSQLLTYLLPCLRCHTSCRLWQCHRLTREVTRWIHTEHHWTNLSRPNSNRISQAAPPITVTVPAPVASTTASISFFLSWAQLESTGSFEFMNLHLSRAFM